MAMMSWAGRRHGRSPPRAGPVRAAEVLGAVHDRPRKDQQPRQQKKTSGAAAPTASSPAATGMAISSQ